MVFCRISYLKYIFSVSNGGKKKLDIYVANRVEMVHMCVYLIKNVNHFAEFTILVGCAIA